MTEAQARELYQRMNGIAVGATSQRKEKTAPTGTFTVPAPKSFEGLVNVHMTLYGHCPSKKNCWERREAGRMILPDEVKQQIKALTMQATFAWKLPGPVEHPELTIRFFVAAKRQDQDGMYTTILDCLQSAGVLVNDNIAHNNGRKVLEPCVAVEAKNERVEILIGKL